MNEFIYKLRRILHQHLYGLMESTKKNISFAQRCKKTVVVFILRTCTLVLFFPKSYRKFTKGVNALIVSREINPALSLFREAGFLHMAKIDIALVLLAKVDLKCRNYSRANALLMLAKDIQPCNADASYFLGLVSLLENDTAQAKLLLMNAVSLNIKYAMPQQNIAARMDPCKWNPSKFDLANDPDLHLYSAYHYLGEILVGMADMQAAIKMFGSAMLLQNELATRYQIPETIIDHLEKYENFDKSKPLRILPYEWVTQIGHIAMIDALLKMQRLGLRPDVNWVLLAPYQKVANLSYLECWKPYLTIVHEQDLIDDLLPYQRICGEQFNCYMDSDSNAVDWSDIAAKAFIEWDRRGLGPLIAIPDRIKKNGEKIMLSLGIPLNSWFVALHARSSGFYNESFQFSQRHRNSPIRNYVPAIKRIVQAGGWVVRVGDSSMPRLTRMKNVVDLAHSPHNSSDLDVYLWSKARFFLGTTSGPANAVASFHTPSLLVNCVSNYAQSWNGKIMFVLKPFWSKHTGRFMKMSEMFSPQFRAKMFNIEALIREGVYPKSNSGRDILDAVEEMMEHLDGFGLPKMQDPGPLEFAGCPMWLWGNAHPSKRFFNNHYFNLIGQSNSLASNRKSY